MTQIIVEHYDWKNGKKMSTQVYEIKQPCPEVDSQIKIGDIYYHVLEVLPEDLRKYPQPGKRIRICEVHLH